MTDKIEGTITLEGLVEGRIPPLPGAEDRMRFLAQKRIGQQIPASLQVDGGRFTVLPDNQPVAVTAFHDDGEAGAGRGADTRPEAAIAAWLDDLLRIFPPSERTQVFSTLRSVEYRPGQEVQTLYGVGPDGRVTIHQQMVKARTTPAAMPLTPRELAIRAGIGVLIAAVVIGISSFFIDYRGMFRQFAAPVEVQKIAISSEPYRPYFTVEGRKVGKDRTSLVLHLKRTADFPASDASLDAAATQAATRPGAVRSRLALDAIARGTLRVEMFDAQGEYLGAVTGRIGGLRDNDAADLIIPLPLEGNRPIVPAKVVLTY